ncbi:MAG: NAD(P)H-dependent oxidoreductase subunit E [Myxococcota bacterium]|nr:NAD(P)H-dependent oxidoreductase subunit E [Myxococcota bacterium]
MGSLIQKLLETQHRDGWLSDEALKGLSVDLGIPLYRLEGLTTFYTHFRREPPKSVRLEVCRDLSCRLAGGREAYKRLQDESASHEDIEIVEVSCLGRCDLAPAASLGEQPVCTRNLRADHLERTLQDARTADVTAPKNFPSMDIYATREDRYGTLRQILGNEPSTLSDELQESGLRGMGGAAFPTGRKWSLVAGAPPGSRHVITNADESEPGSFKDRQILASLPHLVIEGMALAAYCIGAERGTIFIRHEYEPERQVVEKAIREARELGALGHGIFGSSFNFDIEIFVSPGGYILGEETALLECLEDRRGEPRNKPPFPGVKGLNDQPTLINNVETLAHATTILHHGAKWWHDLGLPGFSGQKFMSVSGDVSAPGVHLVPFGTTLAHVLELCGGMKDDLPLGAISPGGASSNFLPPSSLDVAVDFDSLSEAGSMLGSGGAVFIAENQDLLQAALNITRFFRNESCGKCVPCRIGTEKAVAMVEEAGALSEETYEKLRILNETLARTSICGLGQIALGPILSMARIFPDQRTGG